MGDYFLHIFNVTMVGWQVFFQKKEKVVVGGDGLVIPL